MKQYSSFKKVDSFWFTEVPDHWKETKNRYIFKENKNSVGEKWEDFTLLTMGKDGVRIRDLEGGGKFPESFDKYKIVEPDNLIFCLYDIDETPRTVGISKYRGMITSSYDILSVNSDNNPHYWNYFYQNIDNSKSLKPYYTGLRKVVRIYNFKDIKIYTPPLEEQNQIVNFLDKKINQINELIKKIEQKIDLLKEQKNSIINEVVTQGLNPNVEKKESGVEWIGEIPSHWKISKLKYLVSENQESLSNSTDPDLELDYIEISDVNSTGEFKKPTKYIFSESPSRCRRVCRKGDVIISTVRTYLKSIGIIEEQRENLICSTGFSVLTPKSQYLSKYVFYMLRSNWFISKIVSRSEGVSYPSIQSHKLLGTDVVIMDKQEQQKIVEFLDEETQKMDKIIFNELKRIDLLKEYKESLISEVVTGKKKVVG